MTTLALFVGELRAARIRRGLTQAEVAGLTGVNLRSVCGWETGNVAPSLDNLTQWRTSSTWRSQTRSGAHTPPTGAVVRPATESTAPTTPNRAGRAGTPTRRRSGVTGKRAAPYSADMTAINAYVSATMTTIYSMIRRCKHG